jgi:hypothetical protein
MAIVGALAAAALTASAPAATTGLPSPTRFAGPVDNPWFPLRAGTTFVSLGEKDGQASRDVFAVGRGTTTIAGVRCTVVHDLLYLNGRLGERTTDWYAQDRAGNVWYFGEQTAELDAQGRVTSTEGSWQAGVDGARPGIYMPAVPRRGQGFRQEYHRGHAEDRFRVLTVSGPLGAAPRVLLTEERTRLEPGVVDHKLYVRGVGQVLEDEVSGGSERATLVAVRHS